MLKRTWLVCAFLLLACGARREKISVTLDKPTKGFWFLSEKFSYQFMRLELYEKHVEGLPSVTMEFRIRAESAGARWRDIDGRTEITFDRPGRNTLTLIPIKDPAAYQGRYKADRLTLPLFELRLGASRLVMHYTDDEA